MLELLKVMDNALEASLPLAMLAGDLQAKCVMLPP